MKTRAKNRRIIWALDAFDRPISLQKAAIRTLISVSRKLDAPVEPVYVLRPRVDFETEFDGILLQGQHEAAQQTLSELKKKAPIPRLLEPRILSAPNASISRAVDLLCDYARSSGSQLIVANTHARTGLKSVFLGSFAETLMLRSKTPVLTVNPGSRRIARFDHILFPSELTDSSYAVFKKAVALARLLSAKITLFHAIAYPMEPYTSGKIFYLNRYRDLVKNFVEREYARAVEQSEDWASWAHARGVTVDTVIESRPGSIWIHLVSVARRRHAHLIAMESQSGPATSRLIGSTTRQVVRNAPCPVWILNSQYAERKFASAA